MRFLSQSVGRDSATQCAWCERPPIRQELTNRGRYVGACRAHTHELAALTTARTNLMSASVANRDDRTQNCLKNTTRKLRRFIKG